MFRTTLIITLALFFATASSAQVPTTDERDLEPGTMSVAELQKQPITFELDIPYANDTNPRHRLDLYLPKKRKSNKLQVIVFFHGGAWMQGDKSDGADRLMSFLNTGHYAGVSAGYRLSGEAQWPAQIHDCKAAIRWVRANALK
jgi:acetyl esterase/lipase